jgi:hypothetical protein
MPAKPVYFDALLERIHPKRPRFTRTAFLFCTCGILWVLANTPDPQPTLSSVILAVWPLAAVVVALEQRTT